MPRKGLPHTKTVRAKGRTYSYFNTGQLSPSGKPIYVRLPDQGSPQWGATYAALLAARSRRGNIQAELTVPGLIDLYRKSPKFDSLADNSRHLYNYYLDDFADAFPTAPAGKIERQDILRIMDLRAKSPGAANMLCRVVGALYKWARTRGHVDNTPTRDIEMLDSGEHAEWPDSLVQAALECGDARVRLAVHLLLYTAQRIGDVCRMQWADIDGATIRVEQQKTGKVLLIPLHSALRLELAKQAGGTPTMLASNRGLPLTPARLRETIQEFAQKRGFKVVPHGLRKNAVNALLEAGCTAAETAAISGQTLQMVEHYAKRRSQGALGQAAILKWEERTKPP